MNKRMDMKKNNAAQSRKRWSAAIIGIILLLAVGAGLYTLVSQPDTEAITQELKQTSFSERGYGGGVIAEIEVEEKETTPEGTVEDLTEEEPEKAPEEEPKEEPKEEEPAEEKPAEEEPAEEEESLVEAPEQDLSSMIANAKTNVYTIYTDLEQGSGFLFNEKGDILTNAHVVKDAAYITVKNSNGQEFNGRVIGISDTTDIALVRVEEIAGKQPMTIEMSKAAVGTPVFALGSPENISNTSTEGEITATDGSFVNDYQYNNLYEMTANIKPGSSGGPLISAQTGNVLGINSIVLTDQPEIGYAIPIYTVIDQLKEWVANPIQTKEEDVVLQDVEDAYFDEELLRAFISDFYELVPYSLNDDELGYYLFFLLPGSQAETAGTEMVESMKAENREFEAAERTITSVEIHENEAIIKADASFTYHNKESDELEAIEHSAVFTVVIDEYGDYQISEIAIQ